VECGVWGEKEGGGLPEASRAGGMRAGGAGLGGGPG
jgi:hypothetical protein